MGMKSIWQGRGRSWTSEPVPSGRILLPENQSDVHIYASQECIETRIALSSYLHDSLSRFALQLTLYFACAGSLVLCLVAADELPDTVTVGQVYVRCVVTLAPSVPP